MTSIPTETVLETRHYTDDLFSFRTTRPQSFRFRSGEFAMLGLMGDNGKPLLRAYSIASPNWAHELEFFSIKVPDGPLTSRLQHIAPGDEILLKPRPTGTLVLDALLPGRVLWLVSTGTGIAPFTSVARDPETYERFDRVVLTQTCRTTAELQYGIDVVDGIRKDEVLSEVVGDRLTHIASVTREDAGPGQLTGRVTELIETGELFQVAGVPAWSPEADRVMICGSSAMINDTKALCERAGLEEGSNASPGGYVVEKAFVG
ncbi:ferredoxin--NADP reductase [Acuticoccus mangrovi]|uniref:ferredoxin--NADP(+) reductase n=1 Tax=Acuticoccus mangrovi TaxID=2796142 RepID=A0A934IMR0_9HYPH|nr:ferredoxin--NADP reductase [Acuticoccus mangrovi]MBJ3775223.1 ferredoxin--NADP reductase [Acuticoccus mangrovi]